MDRMEGHCKHVDRDASVTICGYPLPCPWHTLVVDLGKSPIVVSQPSTVHITNKQRRRVIEIADALQPNSEGT
jgi:hypothetical protein